MERFTKSKKEKSCRLKKCSAEEWFKNHGIYKVQEPKIPIICNDCPFEELIAKMGEYEDVLEIVEKRAEDDF